MIERLFPTAVRHLRNETYASGWLAQWIREKRVARRDFLKLYLERVAGDSLQALWRAEEAIALSTDSEQLESFFKSLDPDQWADVIRALESYEGDFPNEAIVPTIAVLLNLMPNVPKRSRSIFDIDPRYSIRGIVYRLLRQLPSSEERETAIRAALRQIGTLSGRLELIDIVKTDSAGEPQIIDESARADLELELRNEIRNSPPEDLAGEPGVFWLLSCSKQTAGEMGEPFSIPSNDHLRCALLKGAVWVTRSQSDGPVQIEKTLNWDALLDLVGGEDEVRRIVDSCRESEGGQSLADAVELAEKYLTGWRPPQH